MILQKRFVSVTIPKFKMEKELKLKELLTKMGLGEIFTSAARFSNIADAPLFVSGAFHKAFVEVRPATSEY